MKGKDLALIGVAGIAAYIFLIKPKLQTNTTLNEDYSGGVGSSAIPSLNPFDHLIPTVEQTSSNVGKAIYGTVSNPYTYAQAASAINTISNLTSPLGLASNAGAAVGKSLGSSLFNAVQAAKPKPQITTITTTKSGTFTSPLVTNKLFGKYENPLYAKKSIVFK